METTDESTSQEGGGAGCALAIIMLFLMVLCSLAAFGASLQLDSVW